MKGLELQLGLYQSKLKETNDALEKQAEAVQQLERFNGDANQLRNDIDQLNGVIRDMDNTIEQWNVELDAEPRVVVYDPADKAKLVTPWRQYLVTGFLGLFGFGLAIFGVTFLEFQSRRLNSAVDVAHGLGITVMGDLPALRRRAVGARRGRRSTAWWPNRSTASAPRWCATPIPMAATPIWSPAPATAKARRRSRANWPPAWPAPAAAPCWSTATCATPGAHLVFGLPNDYGFCELLRGEIDVADAIFPTPADGLWMIPAGRCCRGVAIGPGQGHCRPHLRAARVALRVHRDRHRTGVASGRSADARAARRWRHPVGAPRREPDPSRV